MSSKILIAALLGLLLLSCSDDTVEPEDGCSLVEEGAVGVRYLDLYEASPPLDTGPGEQYPPDLMAEQVWFQAFRELQPELATDTWDLDPATSYKDACPLSTIFIHAIDPVADEWCGIMRGFSGGLDISDATVLEVWVNDFDTTVTTPGRGGVLHIDFGRIDEDFYLPDSVNIDGQAVWHDEDQPPYPWTAEEDTGFQGEYCFYPNDFSVDQISPVYCTFPGINCRRANGIHDTEDLNGNGYLETANAYYTVEIPLDTEADIDVRRDYDKVVYADYWDDAFENELKAWRLYRIPVGEWEFVSDGSSAPRLDKIPHMRIWISDVEHLGDMRGPMVEVALIRFVSD